ncbi:hypothetical protein ACOJBO_00195 [Rhizobium beringeri]
MRIINLAHGGFALLGGAAAHVLSVRLGVPFWIASFTAVILVIVLALVLSGCYIVTSTASANSARYWRPSVSFS